MDTATPRTDALVESNRGKPCSQSVDCEFARQLERELIASAERVNEVEQDNNQLRRIIERGRVSTQTELLLSQQLEDQRNGNIKLMERCAGLEAALRHLLGVTDSHGWNALATDSPEYVYATKARQALGG